MHPITKSLLVVLTSEGIALEMCARGVSVFECVCGACVCVFVVSVCDSLLQDVVLGPSLSTRSI